MPTLGGDESQALDVSDDTMVVGWSDTGILGMGTHAFSWTPSGNIVDLTPTAFGSRAFAVSESGWIVGEIRPNAGDDLRAVRWSPGGGQELLTNLHADGASKAFGVNSAGIAVGLADDANLDTRAVLWDASGSPLVLPTLGGTFAEAHDINDNNVVIGASEDAAGNFRAFVWTQAVGMDPLPTPFGGFSFASAINNAGQIVGEMTSSTGSTHAVLWEPNGSTYDVVDLETLGGASSQAFDIDESGRVVGRSSSGAPGGDRPFIWTPGEGIQEIEDVPGTAAGISGDGSVVAGWTPPNFSRATLWGIQSSAPAQDLELSISPNEVEPVLTSGWDAKTRSGPSGTTLPNEVSVIVMVRDSAGGPSADAAVELVATRLDLTGGHAHVHPPPPHGFLSGGAENSVVTLMTDANGRIEVPYRTTGVAGLEEIEARLVDTGGGGGGTMPLATVSDTVIVRLQLVPLGESDAVDLVGETGSHPQNHFGTAATIATIEEVANAFLAERGKKLPVNDMSLEWGGVFDCRQLDTQGCQVPNQAPSENPWGSPHGTHRTGIQVDFSILNDPSGRTPDSRSLERIIKEIARNPLIFEGETSHTHVTFFPR